MTYNELIDILEWIAEDIRLTFGINDDVRALYSAINLIRRDMKSCDSCKYLSTYIHEYPCNICSRRFLDHYEEDEDAEGEDYEIRRSIK